MLRFAQRKIFQCYEGKEQGGRNGDRWLAG